MPLGISSKHYDPTVIPVSKKLIIVPIVAVAVFIAIMAGLTALFYSTNIATKMGTMNAFWALLLIAIAVASIDVIISKWIAKKLRRRY